LSFPDFGNEDIYEEMQKKTDGRTFVDSSKDFMLMMYLACSNKVDFHLVHLVRDGRGIIHSHRRKGESLIGSFSKWVGINFWTGIFAEKYVPEEKYMHISYDKFSSRPVKVIQKLNKKWDLDISTDQYLEDINTLDLHNVTGNYIRKENITTIERRAPWKKWSWAKKAVLGSITYLPNKLWVYY
jgi:hypothetical protein